MLDERVAGKSFSVPRWDSPFDAESEIDAAPPNGTVRGMFFDFVINRASRLTTAPLPNGSRVAFAQYPMRDYMRLMSDCAKLAFPHAPPREQLRRMGSYLYDDFLETMVGRAIFSVAGRKFERIAVLAPKAYGMSYDPCVLRSSTPAPNQIHVTFEPCFPFFDTFHYGAWEGAARFCGTEAQIQVHRVRAGYGEFQITYR